MTLVTTHDRAASATLLLPHGPAGVSRARRRIQGDLAGLGADDTAVDDAVLVLSELLSNAFRHGRPLHAAPDAELAAGRDARRSGTIRLDWRVDDDGMLTLEVTDGGGPTRPRPPSPSLTAHGGRGLGIVDALALDWGFRDLGAEVTVWAELPLLGGPEGAPGSRVAETVRA